MAQAQDGTIGVTDQDLVERFRQGDELAFNEIVGRYSSKVLTICTYYMKDPHEALDVSQEVFIKIYRGLPAFRGDSKLSTWIHTIAINTCRNHISFFRRLFSRRTELNDELVVKSSLPGPEDDVLSRERDSILRREVQALPPRFKEIVILKDLQERSYEEIGEILSINQGTVKSRLHRAREALTERLKRSKAF
ncbi:MAG: sigma-70 family RNA polymerase sigma factor [Candidatus Riflebacteria bacterium]|nr:sigma-70 family RNA polymerase sigma factor [Candidatus Riflebacteria bacterium]